MPDIDDNYTPDFATPEQIASNRAYAKALLQQSLQTGTGTSGNVTAVSPWGGAAQLMQALVGGHNMNVAGDQERQLLGSAANAQAALPVPGAQQQPPISVPGTPKSWSYPISSYADDTASQETGNQKDPYGAIGPKTSKGDNAYGKYQVLGSNIPAWTKEVLGTPLTPHQFLASHEAQDAVYQQKFGQLAQKYGPEGAARAWYGGEGNVNNPNARDLANPNAPTVGQYGKTFAANLPQGGQALGFSGQPATAAPAPVGSPSAMALALRGGSELQPPQPGMGLPSSAPVQTAQNGQSVIPQGVVPMRQHMTKQQFEAITANPAVPPNVKQWALESYYGQNQPQELAIPGGKVIIGAGGQQLPLYDVGKMNTKVGDIERETQYQDVPDPQHPGWIIRRIVPTMGAAPSAAAPAAGSAAPTNSAVPTDLVPSKSNFAPETPGPSSEDAPDIITKGPEAVHGMLGTAPPAGTAGPLSFGSTPAPSPTVIPGAPTPGKQTAQGVLPSPDFDNADIGTLANWQQQRNIATDAAKEFNKKDAETYQKDYDKYQNMGIQSYNAKNQLDIMKGIIEDPRFIQGPYSDPKLALQNVFAAFGDKGAQNATALNQAFGKLKSSGVLADMKTKLDGLGQVRLAEIHLLENAAASQGNTLGANRAILDIGSKFQDQAQQLGQISNWYRQGYRWDQGGHIIKDAQGNPALSSERPTSAGQDMAINQYLASHPLYTDEQTKNYMKMFEDDKKGGSVTPRAKLPLGAKVVIGKPVVTPQGQ